MTLPDASPAHVTDQVSRGHRSTLVAQLARLACKAVSVLVLARILTPGEHGQYAMAASVFLFLFLFRDLNLGTAAIQAPSLSEGQRSALFWVHLFLGAALAVLALAVAPLAAEFYGTIDVRALLMAMAGAFVFLGAGGLPRALLARDLRFNELNAVETFGAVTGTASAIAAAWSGAGAQAFVVYLLVSEATTTLLAWRASGWQRLGPPDWAALRPLLRTGGELTRYHALNYVLNQIDTFAIGRVLGASALGVYNRAGQLLGLTNLHLASPLASVGLAALSRISSAPEEFRRQARDTSAMIGYLTLPLAAVCIALPGEVVRVVLGPQWPEAAPVLRWSAVSMALFTATRLAYSINVAAGQTRRLALTVAASLPFTILAVWLGLARGVAGVAFALAVTNLSLTGPRLWWMLRDSPLDWRHYLGSLFGPAVTAIALGASLSASAHAAQHLWWLPRLGVAGLSGAIALAALAAAWPRLRRELAYVWAHLPGASMFRRPPNL